MKRYILNFVLFCLVLFFQIYFAHGLSTAPVFNAVLIFLIFTIFSFPAFYSLLLAIGGAWAFDSLAGAFWGMYLAVFLAAAGSGILSANFLEKSRFLPRMVIGELTIATYYLGLLAAHWVLKISGTGWIVFCQFFFTSLIFALLAFAWEKLRIWQAARENWSLKF